MQVPVLVSAFMANFIPLPILELPGHEQQPQPPVVQATQAQTSDALPLQVMLPELQSTSTSIDRPPVVDMADHEVVEPQLQSQVIEPNTES